MVAGGAGSSAEAAAVGASKGRALSGHVLKATQNASDLGKVDDQQELPITVSLNLNHEEQLAQELSEIYNPGSPKFHQFLQPEEFRAKYGPTQQQVAASHLLSHAAWFALGELADENGYLVTAVGTVRDLGTAFGTELHQYKDASGRSFRSPSRELRGSRRPCHPGSARASGSDPRPHALAPGLEPKRRPITPPPARAAATARRISARLIVCRRPWMPVGRRLPFTSSMATRLRTSRDMKRIWLA